ncbi:uncharacterized protein LOC128211953 [Mya arenaria]|uniref:uncharacterized protein LOC128211953 n=1 Tax=Mya arenaria TaxID=6604 RepID=UPI0022DF7FE3|nr:uncharacterized protein LOC128211953 [Mya arenaria]
MRFVEGMNSFRESLAESPLPSFRLGSASIKLDMSDTSSDESLDFDAASTCTETEDGRLSRSLQSWMVGHTWSTVQPLEKPPREPIFSAKLGKERRVNNKKRVQIRTPQKGSKTPTADLIETNNKTNQLRRIPSDESIQTQLSLLTCSSLDNKTECLPNAQEKKRKKRRAASRASTTTDESGGVKSKWVVFATRRVGALNQLLRTQNAMANSYGVMYAGGEYEHESEAFRNLEKDEQTSLFTAGITRGLRYIDKTAMKKSDSLFDLLDLIEKKSEKAPLKRTLSANAKRPWGKLLDIADLKRERMNRLLAIEQERLRKEKETSRRSKRPSRKSSSSLLDVVSSSPSASHLGSVTSETPRSVQGSDYRTHSPSEMESRIEEENEEKVTVWKGDREILEIDLKREFTQRVKERITITRTALKRATGYGESNDRQETIGTIEEFPLHTDDDFAHKPRIIQKMRISPHLSGVIHDDIQVRMGRPRYHEIKETDLDQWNRGQALDRAHRNLKVFNWLHSIRNNNFATCRAPEIRELSDEEVEEPEHIEAADEPDVKPLYRAYEVNIL